MSGRTHHAVSSDLSRPAAVASVALLVLATAVSWWPTVGLPFGDSHHGRIGARFALHASNVDEHGLAGSRWASSWEPYAESYAHHPPGANLSAAAVGATVGSEEAAVRIPWYASALAGLVAAAAMLRMLGVSRSAALATAASLAVTPMYWLYGPVLPGLPMLFVVASAAFSLTAENPRRRRVLIASAAIFVGALQAWITAVIAAAALLVTSRTRSGAAKWAPVFGVVAMAAVTSLWLSRTTDFEDLSDQTAERTSTQGLSVADFLSGQARMLASLIPVWMGIVVVIGFMVMVRQRRHLHPLLVPFVGLTSLLGTAWVALFPGGAQHHDYWSYPLLLPAVVSAGVAWDYILSRSPVTTPRAVLGTASALIAALLVANLATIGRSRIIEPSAAGALLRAVDRPSDQAVGYIGPGVEGSARWMAYYWDAPVERVDDPLAIPRTHLVLVGGRAARKAIAEGIAVNSRGKYALVRAAALNHVAGSEPTVRSQ